MKRDYYITVGTNDEFCVNTEKVTGWPIYISGFEDISFFVHKNNYKDSVFYAMYKKEWVVTEESTGSSIAGGDTKQKAIEAATIFLKSKGRGSVRKQINKRLNQIKRLA